MSATRRASAAPPLLALRTIGAGVIAFLFGAIISSDLVSGAGELAVAIGAGLLVGVEQRRVSPSDLALAGLRIVVAAATLDALLTLGTATGTVTTLLLVATVVGGLMAAAGSRMDA